MGRTQMETQISYPPSQVQPPIQTFPYPPQPQQSPQQLYHQPNYVGPTSNNTNLQQISNISPISQPQRISPLVQMPENGHVVMPSHASYPNNAVAAGVPLQVPMACRQINGNMGMVPWTTGLFDCMDDPTNALITGVFPCVTFGQIADVLDNGNTTCATSGIIYAFVPCLVSRPYRRKLRQRFGLVEAPSSDWIIHSIFEMCALCQEYRELNNRGINPALGYHGNLDKLQTDQNSAVMMPPKNQMMNL